MNDDARPFGLPPSLVLTQHGHDFELVWDADRAAWVGVGHCMPISLLLRTVVE